MEYLRHVVDQKFLVLLLVMSVYCTLTTSISAENKNSELNGNDDPRARQLSTPTSRAKINPQDPTKRRRPKLTSTEVTPIRPDRKNRHRSKTESNSTSTLQDGKKRRRPKTSLPPVLQDEPKRQNQQLGAPHITSGPSDSFKGGRRRNGEALTNTETTLGTKKTRRPKKKATDATTTSVVEARTRTTSASRLLSAVTTTRATASTEVSTLGTADDVFRIPIMARLFKECSTSPGDVDMETYLAGYTELLSIFSALGPVFSFAADDVKSKLTTLSQLLADDRKMGQSHYRSFHNMFAYEFSPAGAGAEHEGVDTNRWIHRALKFISGFLRAALERNGEDSLTSVARTLYGQTMAPHHTWLMRAATYLALFSVPNRESLMERIGMVDNDAHRQAVQDMADAIDEVYRRVEFLYVQYSVPSNVVAS